MRKLAWCVLACLICGLFVMPAQAQAPNTDLGEFTKELMAFKFTGSEYQMVMWIPMEFFVQVGMAQSGITPEQAAKQLAVLKPYQAFIVLSQRVQADGTTVTEKETSIRARTSIVLDDGTEMKPITTYPPLLNTLVNAMKAGMAQSNNGRAEDMVVLVFTASDLKGAQVINAATRDKLTVSMKATKEFGGGLFTWRTPFDATSTKATCAKCKEQLSVKWAYCPFCGTKCP